MAKADRLASRRRRAARQSRKALKRAKKRTIQNAARVVLAGTVGAYPAGWGDYDGGGSYRDGGDDGDD